jgi:hypothetical protein
VSAVIPVVTQAAIGAGHWAAGRRRALAAWASAAGSGLVAWGLGTEAPTRAEAQQNIEQQKGLLRERGIGVPATVAPPTARQRSQAALINLAFSVVGMVLGVRSGLRNPAGGPGRAAAQAEDRRRLSPGRRRSGGPAAGGGG